MQSLISKPDPLPGQSIAPPLLNGSVQVWPPNESAPLSFAFDPPRRLHGIQMDTEARASFVLHVNNAKEDSGLRAMEVK